MIKFSDFFIFYLTDCLNLKKHAKFHVFVEKFLRFSILERKLIKFLSNFPEKSIQFLAFLPAKEGNQSPEILSNLVVKVKNFFLGFQTGYSWNTNSVTKNDASLYTEYGKAAFHFRCIRIPHEFGLSTYYHGWCTRPVKLFLILHSFFSAGEKRKEKKFFFSFFTFQNFFFASFAKRFLLLSSGNFYVSLYFIPSFLSRAIISFNCKRICIYKYIYIYKVLAMDNCWP